MDWLVRAGIRRLCEGSSQNRGLEETDDVDHRDEIFANLDHVSSKEGQLPKRQKETARLAFEPVLIRDVRVIVGLFVILILTRVLGSGPAECCRCELK